MYNIYVIFKCLPNMREKFVARVREEGILEAVRAEDGCLRYEYLYSEEEPDTIVLVEAWTSKQHQQVHIEQPHMAKLRSFKNEYIVSSTLGEFEVK